MTGSFEELLLRYGGAVSVTHGGETVQTLAFVQRILKKETDAPEENGNFGAADLRRWLYLGPKSQPLCEGDQISCDEMDFTVQTATPVFAGKKQTHWWALLRPAREVLS